LFFAIIYDGIFLLLLVYFNDYPLENFAIGTSMFNPIDLSRILILLKLDISALMGYTGAVFQKFLGSGSGIIVALGVLFLWVGVPTFWIKRTAEKKDF
jgi:Cu-processing system permease protein